MPFQVADRVRETATTEGTGTVTLAGAVAPFRSFAAALSDGDTTLYAIAHQITAEWEVGIGTYSAGTLARTQVLASSNAGALVSFSAGTKDVFITLPAGGPRTYKSLTGEPDNPVSGRALLWAEEQDGISVLRYKSALGVVRDVTQDSFVIVRNNSGSTITAGSVVYLSGSSGQRPTIGLAQANSEATMPAAGIVPADIGNNTQGLMMVGGHLFKLNTSAFSDGQVVYVSTTTPGGLVSVSPAFPDLIQRVALVTNAHSNQGKLLIDADTVRGRPEIHAISDQGVGTEPATPGTGIGSFARQIAGRRLPAFIGPSGLSSALQPLLGRNKVTWINPTANTTTVTSTGATVTATGTGTAAAISQTSLHTEMTRIDYLASASTTAVSGLRYAQNQFHRGAAAGRGGFTIMIRFGPATGTSVGSRRMFAGLTGATGAPTDVNPSTLTNMIGVGLDAADANLQIMHNDGTGTATKIDTGFARVTTDRTQVWELALFAPPNGSFVGYQLTNLVTGAVFSGTIVTDLPANTVLMSPRVWQSVGGTSSVMGTAVMGIYTETDL